MREYSKVFGAAAAAALITSTSLSGYALDNCCYIGFYPLEQIESTYTPAVNEVGCSGYSSIPFDAWHRIDKEKRIEVVKDAIKLFERAGVYNEAIAREIQMHDKKIAEIAGEACILELKNEFVAADDPVILENIMTRIEAETDKYASIRKNLKTMEAVEPLPETRAPSLADIALYQTMKEYYYQASRLPKKA